MRDNISPEEKLLRLIKGQKKQEAVTAKVAFADSALKPSLKGLEYPLISNRSRFSLFQIIAGLIFVFSFAYLAVSFIYPLIDQAPVKLSKTELEKPFGTMLEIKPYDSYLEGVKSREIFIKEDTAQEQKTEKPKIIDVANAADLIKDINLMGIISGDSPQAILMDKKTQKTYYLNKGESIQEFQLEEILEGKIILNYHGQKFDLYM